MAKKEEPFHAPFKKLKGVKITQKTTQGKKVSPEKPVKPQPPEEPDDREIFASAMRGVIPIGNDRLVPEPADPRDIVDSIRESIRRQDQEVIDTLKSLVRGAAHFDITCTGEYLEGHAIPLDPKTMAKLKAGELTVQGHLDLHGYTRQAAEQVLVSFILSSHALGHRVVLIIHGRGLKSSRGPVLKEQLVRWLTTGSLSHLVLAFCSARPCDGGTGALYVLLKKRPKKSRWNRP